jgi:hypothetical protein
MRINPAFNKMFTFQVCRKDTTTKHFVSYDKWRYVQTTQEVIKNVMLPVSVERYYCFHIHCFVIIIPFISKKLNRTKQNNV